MVSIAVCNMRGRTMRIPAILGAALFLTGCATGFNRQGIEQRLAGQAFVVDSESIQEALDRKPQLRFPIRVAVHLVAESYHPTFYYRGVPLADSASPADGTTHFSVA
jgi:hypothetical protein